MKKLTLLILSVLMLAACSANEGTDQADLEGKTFLSVAAEGVELVEGTTVSLSFEEGNLNIQAGCNHLFGGAKIDKDVLKVENLAATEMGCEEELEEQDTLLSKFFMDSPRIDIASTELTLTKGDTKIFFEEEEDLDLTEAAWMLNGIEESEAISSIPEDVESTLEFTGDQVDVNFGCNSGGGQAQVGKDTIEFGPLRATKMACPEEVMEVENTVASVLDGEVTFEIDGRTLHIGNGQTTLHYIAED